jgi:hypothetical protein
VEKGGDACVALGGAFSCTLFINGRAKNTGQNERYVSGIFDIEKNPEK